IRTCFPLIITSVSCADSIERKYGYSPLSLIAVASLNEATLSDNFLRILKSYLFTVPSTKGGLNNKNIIIILSKCKFLFAIIYIFHILIRSEERRVGKEYSYW